MKVYTLNVIDAYFDFDDYKVENTLIGIFSSGEKATKAWDAVKDTVFSDCQSVITETEIDDFIWDMQYIKEV